MSAVLTGIKKYTVYLGDSAAVATAFASKPWAQALVSAGALAGLTSVLLVFQLGQPRIFMAMARDGLLPQYFARIHPRYRTPHVTTIWTGVVVGGVAMLTDIGSLADLTNIGTLFAFVLVCCGVVILRRKDPMRPRPFRVPFVPVFPLLGVFLCFASDAQSSNRNLVAFLRLADHRLGNLFPVQCSATAAFRWESMPAKRKTFIRPSSRNVRQNLPWRVKFTVSFS